MKKILLSFALLSLFALHLQAQIADGSKAPNFTITDVNGNTHTLYDELGQGKAVFIDFFATWCGSCWSYHQGHALEDLFNTYGPTGHDWARVYAIESSASTTEPCITNSAGCSGGTIGDWTAGTSYPIANANAPGNAYQVLGFPTIMFVCPADTTVWEIGQVSAAAAWNAATNICSTVPAPPQLALNQVTPVDCFGESTGAIDINVGGNGGPFTYLWSNGATTEDLSGIPAGSYALTVTAANTLTSTLPSVVVNQTPLPVTVSLLFDAQPTCSMLGNAFVFASGGTNTGWTYAWNTGETNQQINNLQPGTYTVTATDALGCTDEEVIIMNAPTGQPTAVAMPLGTINCIQQNVDLSSQGSSTGTSISYMWTASNGGAIAGNPTNANIQALSAGTYTLEVTDASSGCTSTSTAIVVEDLATPPFTVAAPSTTLTCAVTEAVLEANGPIGAPYSIQWTSTNGSISSGANSLTPTVGNAGNYTFTATNTNNGCSMTETVSVLENTTQPSVSINAPATLSCNQATITLSSAFSGQGNISFDWTTSNGNIVTGTASEVVMVDATGTYGLVITDAANGCTNSTDVTVTASPDISLNSSFVADVQCNGSADGAATVNGTGGSGTINYLWSNGATGASLMNASAGTYSVTATDAVGCTAMNMITINEPSAILINASATSISAVGANDGTATATATGGTGTLFYTWSNGSTGASISNLAAGTYSLTVTDLNGCSQVTSVTVNAVNCTQSSTTSLTQPVCNGDLGAAEIIVMGGAAPIEYLWSSGETTAAVSMLSSGQYSVSYTDANGCAGSENISISAPAAISIHTPTISSVQCANDLTGSISIGATGGTGMLSFEWSDGQTGATAQNLSAGNYTVSVTDANGCQETLADIQVSAADTELPSLSAMQIVNTTLGTSGQVTLTEAMLGVQASDNCGTVQVTINPSTLDCSNVGPNIVEITATDGAGNLVTEASTVTVEDFIAPEINCPADIVRCENDNAVTFDDPTYTDNCTATVVLSQQSGLLSGQSFPMGITAQSYVVEDGGGNTASCSFSVEIVALEIDILSSDVSCYGLCDGQALIATSGGMAPYSYQLMGNPDPTELCSGIYDLTVTDAMGCTQQESFEVLEPEEITYTIGNVTNDIGNQGLGSISLSVQGGIGQHDALWLDASGTQIGTGLTITGLTAGTYTAIVGDELNCTVTTTEIIIDNTVSQKEPNWLRSAELSPNPSSGLVRLRFAEMPTERLHLSLTDLTGKVLMQQHIDSNRNFTLDLSAFAEGIYLLSIRHGEGLATRKVVIQR